MQFETRIDGIPCICNVTHYSPDKPMRVYGSGWGDCDPPEYEHFEYEILDRKGYKAPWLEKKITPYEQDRLLEELHIELTGERYGYL